MWYIVIKAPEKEGMNLRKVQRHSSIPLNFFEVVCSVPWPLNGSKAGGALVSLKNLPVFQSK